MKDTSKSAFPVDAPREPCMVKNPGMTLREYYAGQALAGMIFRQNNQDLPYEAFPRVVALECIRIADALIAELEGGE